MESQSQFLEHGRKLTFATVMLLMLSSLIAGCSAFVRPPAPAGFSPTVVLAISSTAAPWIVAPTATPEPTVTPIANPLQDRGLKVRKAGNGNLPAIQHDLVFVNSGRLMRWNHRSGQVENLLGGADSNSANISVSTMRAYARLGRAVVVYSDATAPGADYVGLFDFEPLQLRPVFSQPKASSSPALRIADFPLAPDGKNLLAVIRDHERYPHGELVLYSEAGERRLIKQCDVLNHKVLNVGCGAAVWSQDGQSVLWDDGAGFWRLDPFSGAQPVSIARMVESSFGGFMPLAMAQCPGIFHADTLSPDGKQALLILPGYEWWHQGLLDIETQQCMRFDDSFRGHAPVPAQNWQWLPDGQLLVTGPFSQVRRLRITQAPGAAMTLTLSGGVTLAQASNRLALTEHVTADGDVLLAVTSAKNNHDDLRGVYKLDLDAGTMQLLQRLPASVFAPGGSALPSITFAPDGSGLIYRETNGVQGQPELQFALYIGLNGSSSVGELADISALLPAGASDLAWLE